MHYAVTDYVLDIVQNACEARASKVKVRLCETPECIDVVVEDDGKGMSHEEQEAALDPFHSETGKHPGRKVGLGLPFLKQATEQCGGVFELVSEPGRGTRLHFGFDRSNIDCPPVGDVVSFLLSALCLPGEQELCIERVRDDGHGSPASYTLNKGELAEAVGGLEKVASLALLKSYIRSLEEG